MVQVCAQMKITIEPSMPYTPQENGIAEAMNKKMERTAGAMLFHGNMPAAFWEYAENLAAIILSYIVTPNNTISGYEMVTKQKPSMSRIRTFGCHTFAYI